MSATIWSPDGDVLSGAGGDPVQVMGVVSWLGSLPAGAVSNKSVSNFNINVGGFFTIPNPDYFTINTTTDEIEFVKGGSYRIINRTIINGNKAETIQVFIDNGEPIVYSGMEDVVYYEYTKVSYLSYDTNLGPLSYKPTVQIITVSGNDASAGAVLCTVSIEWISNTLWQGV